MLGLAQIGHEPVEIFWPSGLDGKDQELWSFISVQGCQTRLQRGQLFDPGFQQQERFLGVFDCALPPVDGANRRNEGGARNQLFFG